MKESQSCRFYESNPAEEPSSYYWAQINDPNEILVTSSKKDENTLQTAKAFELYCTLESSSGTTSTYPPQNSSSSVSFSPGGSPSSQPETQSSLVVDEEEDLRHKIKELETAMLGAEEGPEGDDLRHKASGEGSPSSIEEEEIWRRTMETVGWGDLRGSLCACARAIERGDSLRAEWLISEIRQLVSVSGDPLQRLGAYVAEGLVARLAFSGSSIYNALRCKEPAVGPELLSYMHLLYEICPYFKFGYMSANGAIAEALRDEPCVHIIDFQIVQGSQWMILLRALATRPGGPPRVRITGIDDSASAHARGGGLGIVGRRLAAVAEACGIPFEFRAVAAAMADVEASDLDVRPGEALAVNFAMALHHVPDESVGGFNHRDRLLRLAKSLSPKVVTLVEQEANTNTAPFYPRFVETLEHYLAVFESMDVALPRDHKQRISIEQHCLARDVVNLVACEGAERVERHEPHGKWRARLAMAGFHPCPLSPLVNATIRALLADYNRNFALQETHGALFLGWGDKPLVVASAWR